MNSRCFKYVIFRDTCSMKSQIMRSAFTNPSSFLNLPTFEREILPPCFQTDGRTVQQLKVHGKHGGKVIVT